MHTSIFTFYLIAISIIYCNMAIFILNCVWSSAGQSDEPPAVEAEDSGGGKRDTIKSTNILNRKH